MRKRAYLAGFLFVLAIAFCITAYAADGGSGNTAWTDFWNGVGGFLSNAMPWNWSNWAGK